MQVYGAIVIAFFAMSGGLSLAAPETIVNAQYDWIEEMQKDQPPAERQKLPPRDEAIKSQRVQGPIYAVLWIAAGIVMFIGGSKMKELRGYGWSLAGSIVCLFPGCLCCCTGMLPGIWALVVLLNSDVKLAFSRNTHVDRDARSDDSRIDDSQMD
jgi:hypothetical protein